MSSAHKPDESTRKQVESMSAVGVPQDDIAQVIGVSKNTLRKYYQSELDSAAIKANAMIANKLYSKAIGGDTTSIIFWLKTRARWREGIDIHRGDAAPIQVIIKRPSAD